MLPTTGWVGDEILQSDPLTLPLPIEYFVRYADGGTGVVDASSGAVWKANWRFIDCGVRLVEGYSVPGSIPVLTVDLVQPNVFGVLLFDWFTPPLENYGKPYSPAAPVMDPNATQDVTVVAPVYTNTPGGLAPSFNSADGASTPIFGIG